MDSKSIFLLTIALILLHLGLASSDGSLQNGTSTAHNNSTSSDGPAKDKALQAEVSKVIDSFAGDSVVDHTSQEHAKKGRIIARKGVDMNITATTSTPIATLTMPKGSEAQQHNITTTPPLVGTNNTIAVGAGNATQNIKLNSTMPTTAAKNVTSNGSADIVLPSSSKPTSTTTTSTTSTTTTSATTTTTSTTTTTTKPPKKPKITFSVDDEPKLLQAAKPGYNSPASPSSAGSTVSDASGRLHVEEPLVELSKEYIPPRGAGGHREYVIPVVTLIFAIPLLMGLFLLSYRRAKEFWLTRHYRRMDFLVDGMYNY